MTRLLRICQKAKEKEENNNIGIILLKIVIGQRESKERRADDQ